MAPNRDDASALTDEESSFGPVPPPPSRPHPEDRTPTVYEEEGEAYGEEDVRIDLVSHGKYLSVGNFLAPEERVDFGETLKRALATWRDRRRKGALRARVGRISVGRSSRPVDTFKRR